MYVYIKVSLVLWTQAIHVMILCMMWCLPAETQQVPEPPSSCPECRSDPSPVGMERVGTYNAVNKTYNAVNKAYNALNKTYNTVNKTYNAVNKT